MNRISAMGVGVSESMQLRNNFIRSAQSKLQCHQFFVLLFPANQRSIDQFPRPYKM